MLRLVLDIFKFRSWALTKARISRLGREGLWVVLGHAMAVVGALIGVRLLTEFLDPIAYGELALGMTVATLVQQIVFGPLNQGAMRWYALANETESLGAYLWALLHLVLVPTGLILGMSLIMSVGLAATAQTDWVALGLAVVSFSVLSGGNVVLDGIQGAARQRTVVAWHQSLAAWSRFVLAAVVMLVLGSTSAAAMWGYTLGSLIVLGSQLWLLRRTPVFRQGSKPVPSTSIERWRRQLWQYSWPFATWGIFSWAQQASDRWALQAFASTQDVGYYAVLFQIGHYPIMLMSTIFVQWMAPILFERAGDGSDVERMTGVRSMTRVLLVLTAGSALVASLITWGLHDQIFHVLAAPEYGAMSPYLPWMVLSGGLFAVGQTMSLQLMSEADSRFLIVPKVMTAFWGIGANAVGAFSYGIVGVIAANLITALLYLLMISVVVNGRMRHSGQRFAEHAPRRKNTAL